MAAKKICCSIETEPRTLNEGQLNHAREVAVDIFQNKELDEASNIFNEGLKPVIRIHEQIQITKNEDSVYKIVEQCKEITKNDNNGSYCCQCSLVSSIIDSPDEFKPKEPLSAPF